MNKILIISGPTATGKTKIALSLSKQFNGELLSADSRQVYKGMDIGTGKDYSRQVEGQRLQVKKIWGYDVVQPNEEWSAAHFVKFATEIIADILQRGKLPIVVGGTGLYIKNLLNPPQTLFVTPDKKLRERLQQMTVSDLQTELQRVNPKRLSDMNESDQKNPRRLVRAIEVATIKGQKGQQVNRLENINTLHIALTAPLEILDKRIEERIDQRLNQGIEEEIRLLVKKYGWESALSHTIAYQEWRPFLQNKETREASIATWTLHEKQYVRRQLTWLRKQKKFHWFDIAHPNYPKTIVSVVRQWYDGR